MAETVLLGCGGHGRVLLDGAQMCGMTVHGILDPRLLAGEHVMGVPVLGGDDWLESVPGSCAVIVGIGANPALAARRAAVARLASRHTVAGVRHPGAVLSRHATIDATAQVMAGVVLQAGAQVGPHVVLNTGARIDHDVLIESFAFIAPGAVLCGQVSVGEGAFIGAGAVLLPGVNVGAGAIVAAATLVRRNVAPGSKVAGVPARIIAS